MRTVFADANILIAAAGSRQGASRAVLNLAEMGLIRLVVSRQVLLEAERNLRLKLPTGLPLLAEWLSYLNLEVVADPPSEAFIRWFGVIEAKDAPILEAAVAAQVDYFLTLNTKDFTPEVATAADLTILTPAQFVERAREVLGSNL
jgi:predicted nucleic acid-binding protein